MSESDITKEIQLEASKSGARLLRNNRGCFQDKQGNWVEFGVGGDGGSDLVGYRSIIITADMVGKKIAQTFVVEVKTVGGEKKTKKDRLINQMRCIDAVKAAGGIGFISHSAKEFREQLNNA